jgi:hypothetical protein
MTDGPLLPALPEGFGRAAEKLADTVSHVVDIVVGPDRIRARAQAQSDAAVIFAEGRAQIQEIEARAVDRLRKRETRRQRNIETITLKAADELKALPAPDQISKEPVSEDWTSRFFEECQDISDEQMQQIWARIMAGEVAQPGSFAPRTLSVVRDLTKDDANLFTRLCQLIWLIPRVGFVPVILNPNLDAPEIVKAEIDFPKLTHLTSIGLIEYNSMTAFGIKTAMTEIAPSYCGAVHQLESDGGHARIFQFGHAILTAVGRELSTISGAEGNDEYRKATLATWSQNGWKEESRSNETK